MTFTLKPIHKDAIQNALVKADKYRVLNDPSAAESICLDILAIDSENQQAAITLILALTDQFSLHTRLQINQVLGHLPKLKDDYVRTYYSGIIYERWGKAQLDQSSQGSRHIAFDSLVSAMTWYEKAEKIHPTGNDDSILRYNSCVRLITRHQLTPQNDDEHEPYYD